MTKQHNELAESIVRGVNKGADQAGREFFAKDGPARSFGKAAAWTVVGVAAFAFSQRAVAQDPIMEATVQEAAHVEPQPIGQVSRVDWVPGE